MNAPPQRQGLLCVIRSLTHPDFGCVKRFAEWFCVRLSFLFSSSPPPPSRISSTLAPLIGRPDTQARVKASVSGVSLLQLSPFSLSSFTFSPRNDWYSGYTMEHLQPIFQNKMTRWLAGKLSSSDHCTLLSKPLIFVFPPPSSLLVYSYLTIYNVNIL